MPESPVKPVFKLARLTKAKIEATPRITGFGADHQAAKLLHPLPSDFKIIPKGPGPGPDLKKFTFNATKTYIAGKGALYIRNADYVFPGSAGGSIIFSQNTKAAPVAFFVLLQQEGSYFVDVDLGVTAGPVNIRITSDGPDKFMTIQPLYQTVHVIMNASEGHNMFAIDTNNVLSSWSLESITFRQLAISG
jgi:hypothetical protein